MTASVTSSPRYASASSFKERRMKDESSSGVNVRFPSLYSRLLPMLRLNAAATVSG